MKREGKHIYGTRNNHQKIETLATLSCTIINTTKTVSVLNASLHYIRKLNEIKL